jgi:hypothetical protein
VKCDFGNGMAGSTSGETGFVVRTVTWFGVATGRPIAAKALQATIEIPSTNRRKEIHFFMERAPDSLNYFMIIISKF